MHWRERSELRISSTDFWKILKILILFTTGIAVVLRNKREHIGSESRTVMPLKGNVLASEFQSP